LPPISPQYINYFLIATKISFASVLALYYGEHHQKIIDTDHEQKQGTPKLVCETQKEGEIAYAYYRRAAEFSKEPQHSEQYNNNKQQDQIASVFTVVSAVL
jgi:hypothetical protein